MFDDSLEKSHCARFTEEAILRVLRCKAPYMKQLIFPHSPFWTQAGLARAVRMCPHLTSLNLEDCLEFRNKGAFFKQAHPLVSLNVQGTDFLEWFGPTRCQTTLFNSLVRLDVSLSSTCELDSLKLVMRHCPVLRELDMSKTRVRDETIEYIAHECPFRLEHLSLVECDEITEKAFVIMAAKMLTPMQRTLSYLNVKDCPGAETILMLFGLITSAKHSLVLYESQEDNREAYRSGLREHRHIHIVFNQKLQLKELFGCSKGWVCCPDKVW
eukprot:TRINITY_DN9706_c0_g1_i7.p1 TRINITY_DN9706_c0_g1~~TRINITY_DN9706_c0_g1_i7.p1  ORF type:complete len:270 (-),score=10.78 TRINITY_DN9706_c0_g1_i7:40-849(-)